MQYTKSDKCLICGKDIYNGSKDGKFLCYNCQRTTEEKISNLLKESKYAEQIKHVDISSYSRYGAESHKTITIKVAIPDTKRHVYVKIDTDKFFHICQLMDKQLLFDYLEIEIKCQYALNIRNN